MPTTAAARASIYDRMIAQWNLANGQLAFEGEQFEPDGTAYVRLMVRHDTSTQRSFGVRRFRRPGRIIVQCFSPSGEGIQALDNMQELIRAIFEGVSFDSLDTYASTPREGGEEGGYIRGVVETPFDYDEIK